MSLRLERRDVPTVEADIGNRVVAFALSRLGVCIGGGECAHLATEALRAGGARFAWLSGAVSQDYAWGKRVGVVRAGGVVPELRPGDLLQFAGAVLEGGMRAGHHTAIVEVGHGAQAIVLQQNWGGERTVTRGAFDLSSLTAGRVTVYRPQPRPASVLGVWQFTVTNTLPGRVRIVERSGAGPPFAYVLTAANTSGAFQVRTWQAVNVPVIWVGNYRLPVRDAHAYAVTAGGIVEV